MMVCVASVLCRDQTLRHPKIRAADQEEAEIWLAQLLIKLRVAAAGNIDIVSVMRLLAYAIVDGIATGNCAKADARLSPKFSSRFARQNSSP